MASVIDIAGSDAVLAELLHEEAHRQCFIANSVTFPITGEPTVVSEGPSTSPA